MKKLFLSAIAAASLAITPAIAQVGPGYVPAQRAAVWTVCLNDPSTSVHLRAAASRNSRSLGRLYQGQPLGIVRRFISSDGFYWVQVVSPIGTGYVRDDYACP